MADPKLLDEIKYRPKPLPIPGGSKRPSLRVSLTAFPQVRRRQELNVMLLANGCGNGRPVELRFRPQDLRILVQMAQERESETNPLLRRQAISALSQFRDLEAAEALVRLAQSEVEHPSIRVTAKTALRALSPALSAAIETVKQEADEGIRTKVRRKAKKSAPPQDN
jgi:hypothetical protein